MNSFRGHIRDIKRAADLALIQIMVGDLPFYSIVIEGGSSDNDLKNGDVVEVLFKETEVIIGLEVGKEQISMRNHLPCTIAGIERGDVLCEISLQCAAGALKSVITTGSADRLALQVGQQVTALIKTNEIMLSYD